jgi:hypothetical protein
MILFLNPLGDYFSQDNLTESKYIKLLTDELLKLNKNLLLAPDSIIGLIDKIFIIVDEDAHFQYLNKNLIKIQSALINKSKKSKSLCSLIQSIKTINSSDEYDRFISMNTIYLEDIIFFNFTLTNSLCMYLIGAKNIYGYRYVEKEQGDEWAEITDPDRYLLISTALFYNYIGVENVKEMVRIHKRKLIYSYIDYAKREFEDNKVNKHRFIWGDPNKENYSEFISALQLNFGQSFVITCNEREYFLPRNKESLLILNAEKLGRNKRSELLHELLTGEYQDKLVVIVDSDPVELEGYPQIKEWLIVPDDDKTNLLNKDLFRSLPIVEMIKKETDKFRYFINRTILSSKEKQNQLAIIEQISCSGRNFIPAVVEFWYEYDGVETEDMKTWMAKTSNEIENYLFSGESIEKINFKISLDKLKDIWVVEKNGILIDEITYSRSKGMMYIVYLSKYYRKKTISDSDLRNIIDKWHGKSTKTAEVSTDAKKILQDLKYLFEKQCPELSPLSDCIIISSKEPGCYFKTNENISVEIFADDVPGPI